VPAWTSVSIPLALDEPFMLELSAGNVGIRLLNSRDPAPSVVKALSGAGSVVAREGKDSTLENNASRTVIVVVVRDVNNAGARTALSNALMVPASLPTTPGGGGVPFQDSPPTLTPPRGSASPSPWPEL
jgi:hypothetical protein